MEVDLKNALGPHHKKINNQLDKMTSREAVLALNSRGDWNNAELCLEAGHLVNESLFWYLTSTQNPIVANIDL